MNSFAAFLSSRRSNFLGPLTHFFYLKTHCFSINSIAQIFVLARTLTVGGPWWIPCFSPVMLFISILLNAEEASSFSSLSMVHIEFP